MPSSLPSLHEYHRIVFFTGAGLSSESGIPTYRGAGGVWSQYNYEDFACQRAFDRDPSAVWDFHDTRRQAVASCSPNDGHRVIARIQRRLPATTIITQNIDGLHHRAASERTAPPPGAVRTATEHDANRVERVIELHGSLWRVRCDRCKTRRDDFSVPMSPRTCSCGAFLRPDIVWFEDSLDPLAIHHAMDALQRCDLLVSVGTSAFVYPAADLPRIAIAHGATTVEINLEDTPLSPLYEFTPRGKASEILRQMATLAP